MPQTPPPQRAASAWSLCVVLAASAFAGQAWAQRLAAPETAECARDHLTVYSGVVVAYRREMGRTTLRIRTDWDTVETVSLLHPGSPDASRWFLIEREPFTAADWARIEAAPGKLRPSMRAAAWVCDDGRPTVLDWQPPRQP